jgi:hypothetical protein
MADENVLRGGVERQGRPSIARRLQDRVLQDARALGDVQQALVYFEQADGLWEAVAEPALSAIYKAGVVTYTRPFISARSPGSGRTQVYPLREHQNADGFEREVHEHLLGLRNHFLAHADPSAYPSRLAKATFNFDFDTGEKSVSEIGIFTCVYSWSGVVDRDYLHRMMRHAGGLARSIEAGLRQRMGELQQLLGADPDALGALQRGAETEARRVEAGQRIKYGARDLGALTWKEPDQQIGGPAYAYRVSNVMSIGKHVEAAAGNLGVVSNGPAIIDFNDTDDTA